MKKCIAYLGMGIMGSAMAANLARAGCAVAVWNRTPGRPGLETASAAGATIQGSIKDAVAGADVIFVCVNDVSDVEEVILGQGGVGEHAASGAVVVDMGTTGTRAAVKLSEELRKRGIKFVDAPVTGGDIGARNATLTILVGGDPADYEEVKPFLELLGKKIVYCGQVGSGQGVKLCNQILCAVNLIGVCESLCLADELGINRSLVIDALSTGAGGSWSLSNLGPRIIAGDFKPAFMIKLILKDIKLIEQTLAGSAVELPGTELSKRLLNIACEIGGVSGGDQGTQAMFRAYMKEHS